VQLSRSGLMVTEGYRAMNDRQAIKVMVKP